MLTRNRVAAAILPALLALVSAPAQDAAPGGGRPGAPAPVVVAAPTADGVRLTAHGAVEVRLEVFDPAGERVFETEFRRGNILDWAAARPDGQTMPDGTYLYVVTLRGLDGRLSQRRGLAEWRAGAAALRALSGGDVTAAQVRAWETSRQAHAIEPHGDGAAAEAVTVAQGDGAPAVTLAAHDGRGGQLVTTHGDLSFRGGDFFTGRDKELMRLSADGSLEVSGSLTARGGIRFSDGTVLSSAAGFGRAAKGAKAPASAAGGGGDATPSVTADRLAKFADAGGTLVDSNVTESAGNVGIGTTTPALPLDVSGAGRVGQLVLARGFAAAGKGGYLFGGRGGAGQIDSEGGFFMANDGTSGGTTDGPYVLLRGNQFSRIAGQRGSLLFGAGTNITGAGPGEGAVVFNTGGSDRVIVTAAGNLGVGTANPQARLDVAGTVNASAEYRLAGQRVLGVTGAPAAPNSNLFLGPGAGQSTTPGSPDIFSGTNNTFVGSSAGLSNTTGGANSFFGFGAGRANTTSSFNSFFGHQAGFSNTAGSNNAFFGSQAGHLNTAGTSNSFFGAGAGLSNTSGSRNSFFGMEAGRVNTTGGSNSFFGMQAGVNNTTGDDNSFFGRSAGSSNTTASGNSFFGRGAGAANTTGNLNSFFGASAGLNNTTGEGNSFFGASAGQSNTFGFDNSFFGREAGSNNTGIGNSFFGRSAGFSNTSGFDNAFFGREAGFSNTIGNSNSFFGKDAGRANTTGGANSFFGNTAGAANTTGGANSFFGRLAGNANTAGANNSFFGLAAGGSNTTGSRNIFIGSSAGNTNTTGSSNTVIGVDADTFVDNLTNATAIGHQARVDTDNSLVLGSVANRNGASQTVKVGIGTTAPTHRLTVGHPETPVVPTALVGVYGPGSAYSIVRDTTNSVEGLFGAESSAVLYGAMTNHQVQFRTGNITRVTIHPNGLVQTVGNLSVGGLLDVTGIIQYSNSVFGGEESVCRNNQRALSSCSSSLRYKDRVRGFAPGLDLVGRLRPVQFRWKGSGRDDLGLVAEEVAEAEPLLVTRNDRGEVEGVKYDRVGVVLLNAVREQQQQITEQQAQLTEQRRQIERQERQIDDLKRLVCLSHPGAQACR
jgi:hypothetical protein